MKKQRIFYKVIAILLVLFAFLLSGCQKNTTAEKEEKLQIVATIFPPYDFAREIGKDRVEVTMLLRPGTESHSFEPSPADILAIENCDIFLYNGGESDAWVERLLNSIDTPDCTMIRMMECVEKIEEEEIEGLSHSHEHVHDSVHIEEEGSTAEYDEHVWTSPRNAMEISDKIATVMMEKDPKNRSFYQENLVNYLKKLEELDHSFHKITEAPRRNMMIFGDRFPFRYFTETYHLEYRAAFPGCSAESEPSVKTVAYLIDKIEEEKIPYVFYIEFSNQRLVRTLQEETGAKPLLFHSCHNLSKEEMDRGETYLHLMQKNAEHLKEALHGEANHL